VFEVAVEWKRNGKEFGNCILGNGNIYMFEVAVESMKSYK
jgi:hypothetical protein